MSAMRIQPPRRDYSLSSETERDSGSTIARLARYAPLVFAVMVLLGVSAVFVSYSRHNGTARPEGPVIVHGKAIEPLPVRIAESRAAALANLRTRFPDAPELPLYEGVGLLLTGKTDAAITALDRATTLSKGTEWEPDADYYGARALLAAGLDQGRHF